MLLSQEHGLVNFFFLIFIFFNLRTLPYLSTLLKTQGTIQKYRFKHD